MYLKGKPGKRIPRKLVDVEGGWRVKLFFFQISEKKQKYFLLSKTSSLT